MCNEIDLSKAKVGDMIRSVINGIGKVVEVHPSCVVINYPHMVGEDRVYLLSGKYEHIDLYPEIVEWQPAKRKVRKEITVWVNVYKNSIGDRAWKTKESASSYGLPAIAVAVPCTGSYEVDE